jgi:quercetin dioxygenase-like cupin family protein
MGEVVNGEGYAVANLDDLGDGPGFRKIRSSLGVTAFGMNAVVIPAGIESGRHFHDEQEEVYFVHQGELEFVFGEGGEERHRLGPGGIARVSPNTIRQIRNVGDGDAVYVCIGGKGGYVGRDGRVPDGEENRARPIAS